MTGYGASNVLDFAEAGGEEPRANLEWVSNIRWAAISGQFATLVTVRAFMHIALPLAPLLSIIAVEVALNLALRFWLRSLPKVPQWAVSASIGVDVLSFTALLYFTSGPFNPFFVLYLVHIALAMLVLRTASAWRVAALAFACCGALFAQHRWLGVGWNPHAFGNVKAVVLHSQAPGQRSRLLPHSSFTSLARCAVIYPRANTQSWRLESQQLETSGSRRSRPLPLARHTI